jgi:hypothetical protein
MRSYYLRATLAQVDLLIIIATLIPAIVSSPRVRRIQVLGKTYWDMS